MRAYRRCDYGKPMYDKEEDFRDSRGKVNQEAARQAPKIGNSEMPNKRGYAEPINDPRLWGQGNQGGQSNQGHVWGQQ